MVVCLNVITQRVFPACLSQDQNMAAVIMACVFSLSTVQSNRLADGTGRDIHSWRSE